MSESFQKKNKNNKSKNQKDFDKEKNLYPALNNQINQNNILDYFVFDEDENNIIINPKKEKNKNEINKNEKEEEEKGEKENNPLEKIKINYNVNSFITSSYRPDLYSPYGIISGNKYKLRMAPGKSSQIIEDNESEEENDEKEDKESRKEEDKESSSISEKENNDEVKKSKLNRYYNIEPDISIKCHICGQVGHRKDICPNYDIKFCYRCLSDSHEDRDCEQIKCFRCNKLGHKTFNCQLKDNKLILCERCHCIGHKKEECLIKPLEFSHKFLKYNNLSCMNCGSKKHVLCSLVNREFPELSKEDENELFNDENIFIDLLKNESDDDCSSLTPLNEEVQNLDEINNKDNLMNNEEEEKKNKKKKKKIKKVKNIFEDLNNEDIKNTIFCGFCGGRHRNEECTEKKDEKFNNKFDEQRKSLGKRIFENKRKEEERSKEKEDQKNYFSHHKRSRDNNFNNFSFQKNQETRFNNKYKNKYKDKSNSKNKKNNNMALNEDDLSENENNYNNKNIKNKYFKKNSKSKDKNYKNKNIKISNFSNN